MNHKSGLMGRLRVIGFTLVGLALLLFLYHRPAVQQSAENSGSQHPGFPLPDFHGKMDGPSNYFGKVVLVNFWATWCPPCRYEIPDLIELYKTYQPQGLIILGVALDDKEDVTTFVDQYKINYPVLIGDEKIKMDYDIRGIPVTLILNRQGKLYQRLDGLRSREELEATIKSLL